MRFCIALLPTAYPEPSTQPRPGSYLAGPAFLGATRALPAVRDFRIDDTLSLPHLQAEGREWI